MTGKQLAAALRKTAGKVAVEAVVGTHNEVWLYVQKSDLIQWALQQGDDELGVELAQEDAGQNFYIKTVR